MKPLTVKILAIALIFILSATGCKKNYVISSKQIVLFQLDYLNYAWGYQHSGYLIDRNGNILKYKNPENWNFPDKNFELSTVQVAENTSMCSTNGEQIPKDELQKYIQYIEGIASSKVTASKNVAADAGTYEYICYLYSEDTGRYKGYIIKREGDFTCENLNFYTKKVTLWMKNLNKKTI